MNSKDLLPVSPGRPSDRLCRISPLCLTDADDGRSAGAVGGGASTYFFFLKKRKEKYNWGMFYCWVSSGTRRINRQEFCITQVRRARRRWNARLSLREMTRRSWAGSSCISYSVCEELWRAPHLSPSFETVEGAEYGTLRPDVTEYVSICCTVLVPGNVALWQEPPPTAGYTLERSEILQRWMSFWLKSVLLIS